MLHAKWNVFKAICNVYILCDLNPSVSRNKIYSSRCHFICIFSTTQEQCASSEHRRSIAEHRLVITHLLRSHLQVVHTAVARVFHSFCSGQVYTDRQTVKQAFLVLFMTNSKNFISWYAVYVAFISIIVCMNCGNTLTSSAASTSQQYLYETSNFFRRLWYETDAFSLPA